MGKSPAISDKLSKTGILMPVGQKGRNLHREITEVIRIHILNNRFQFILFVHKSGGQETQTFCRLHNRLRDKNGRLHPDRQGNSITRPAIHNVFVALNIEMELGVKGILLDIIDHHPCEGGMQSIENLFEEIVRHGTKCHHIFKAP